MKILQITSGKNVNGAVVYCKLLSEQLVAAGHTVSLVARTNSWLADHIDRDQIPYRESDLKRLPPGELRRFAAWIRSEQFDIIHTHMSRANTFGILLKWLVDVPVVATAHANHFQPHWAYNDFVIANSEATLRFQLRVNRVPRQRIAMIHCFTDLARFEHVPPRSVRIVKRQMRLHENEFVIGVVGDVLPRKGQLYMARALPRILAEVPSARVVFLGRFHRQESYARQVRGVIRNEGLYRRIKWLGLRDNVQDFMAAFDLCVVPSLDEPLGLVAIEALAAGTAVVASNVGGLPEIVEAGRTGLLVPPRNEAALADAVIAMARDRNFRIESGQRGREEIFARFDPRRLTEEVVEIYRSLSLGKVAA